MKKICVGCMRNRKFGKFARDKNRPDGKRIYCRDCISVLNRRYRNSPIGRIKHQRSVDNWKKKNKDAIREYNKAYYIRKRDIILYNRKCRLETIPMLPEEPCWHSPDMAPHKHNEVVITINPKRRSEFNG